MVTHNFRNLWPKNSILCARVQNQNSESFNHSGTIPRTSMRESHFLNYHTFNCVNKYYRTSINKFLKAINSFITLNKRVFRTLSMEFFLKKYSTAGNYC